MTDFREEVDYWKKQVLEAKRNQLETVRKAATTWSGLYGAILGIFGTVSFAGGLTGIEDLDEGLQTQVKVATLAAAFLMLVATVLAGLAAGHSARTTSDTDWESFRTDTDERANRARKGLRVANVFGLLAAAIVFLGSAAVLWEGEAASPAKKAPTVVVVVDGTAVCGKLAAGAPGLKVDGTTLTGQVASLVVVDACP